MATASQRRLRARVRAAVTSGTPEALSSELVLERLPYIFQNQWRLFRDWRQQLAGLVDVDPCDIFITGSAATGVSLSPNKALSHFGERSDIDIAVISAYHFDMAWRHIRSLKRSSLRNQEWLSIKAHKDNYIYWGCIATDQILHLLPFAKNWIEALSAMEGIAPTEGRTNKVRIYRDNRSLRDYTANSIRNLQVELSGAA